MLCRSHVYVVTTSQRKSMDEGIGATNPIGQLSHSNHIAIASVPQTLWEEPLSSYYLSQSTQTHFRDSAQDPRKTTTQG